MSSIERGSSAQAFWVYVVGPEPAGLKQNSRTAPAAGCGRPNFGRPSHAFDPGVGPPRCAMPCRPKFLMPSAQPVVRCSLGEGAGQQQQQVLAGCSAAALA